MCKKLWKKYIINGKKNKENEESDITLVNEESTLKEK
jgi:hypothetical protein